MDLDWHNAVQDVLNGSSIKKAAEKYGVKYTTLYTYIKTEHNKYAIMPPRGRLLYDDEEEKLEQFVIHRNEIGLPCNIQDVIEAAQRIIDAFPRPLRHNQKPGRKFAMNFLKRCKNLRLTPPKTSKKTKASTTIVAESVKLSTELGPNIFCAPINQLGNTALSGDSNQYVKMESIDNAYTDVQPASQTVSFNTVSEFEQAAKEWAFEKICGILGPTLVAALEARTFDLKTTNDFLVHRTYQEFRPTSTLQSPTSKANQKKKRTINTEQTRVIDVLDAKRKRMMQFENDVEDKEKKIQEIFRDVEEMAKAKQLQENLTKGQKKLRVIEVSKEVTEKRDQEAIDPLFGILEVEVN